jgi:hypothetical protein
MNETNFGCAVVHWCSKEEAKKRIYPISCLTASYDYYNIISCKRTGELTSCKISVKQDAHTNIVELMEVETAPVHNVIAFFSEGILHVLCPFARAQLAAAVDVALLKPFEGTQSPYIDVDSQMQDPSLYNLFCLRRMAGLLRCCPEVLRQR